MNLPLFLVPRAARTVRVQRLRLGELVGAPVDVASRPADLRAAFFAFAPPFTELRIYGAARALSRVGAVLDPSRFPPWGLSLATDGGSLWVPCYETDTP